MAPSSCLLNRSPDSELMVQTFFFLRSFLTANLLLLALGFNAFLAPDIFGKEETILYGLEKCGPISEDTALGHFLSGMARTIWLPEHGKVRVPLPTLGPL